MHLSKSSRISILRWIVAGCGVVLFWAASTIATGVGSGCGGGQGTRDFVEEIAQGLEDDQDDLSLASSSRGEGLSGDVGARDGGDGPRYRPPSLPPSIDHPSFIVIARPEMHRRRDAGDSLVPQRTLEVEGMIVDSMTGRAVAGETVTGVQVRMVPVVSGVKAMRRMKATVSGDVVPLEIDVQHDVTDPEGGYFLVFEEVLCGDQIWIATPSSNTVVLQACADAESIVEGPSDPPGDPQPVSEVPPVTEELRNRDGPPPDSPPPPEPEPSVNGETPPPTVQVTAPAETISEPGAEPPPPDTTTVTEAPVALEPVPGSPSVPMEEGEPGGVVDEGVSGDTVVQETVTLEGDISVVVAIPVPVEDETVTDTMPTDPAVTVITIGEEGQTTTGDAAVSDGVVVTVTQGDSDEPPVISAGAVMGDLLDPSVIMETAKETSGCAFIRIDRKGDTIKTSYSSSGKKGSFVQFFSQTFQAGQRLGLTLVSTISNGGCDPAITKSVSGGRSPGGSWSPPTTSPSGLLVVP